MSSSSLLPVQAANRAACPKQQHIQSQLRPVHLSIINKETLSWWTLRLGCSQGLTSPASEQVLSRVML